MRIFKHFPKSEKCPVCRENTDSECILAGLDGTKEGNIEEAIPIHVECISLRYLKGHKLIYHKIPS
jgi:hypothetical protein